MNRFKCLMVTMLLVSTTAQAKMTFEALIRDKNTKQPIPNGSYTVSSRIMGFESASVMCIIRDQSSDVEIRNGQVKVIIPDVGSPGTKSPILQSGSIDKLRDSLSAVLQDGSASHFSNYNYFCSGDSYAAARSVSGVGSDRKLAVTISRAGFATVTAYFEIGASGYASVAKSLNGAKDTDFLKLSTIESGTTVTRGQAVFNKIFDLFSVVGGASTPCNSEEVLSFNGTAFECAEVSSLVNGISTFSGDVTGTVSGEDVELTIGDGKVTAPKLAADSVGTAKIQNDAVTFAKMQKLSGPGFVGSTGAGLQTPSLISITPGSGISITNVAGGISIANTAGGTVTSVTASASPSYISVSNSTTAPVISANVGTTPGTLARGDDPRIVEALQPSTPLVGDVTGPATSTSVVKIRGIDVASDTPTDGQVLLYKAGADLKWTPSNISIGNLKTLMGAQQFPSTGCTANQTLIWTSLTDMFSCTAISGLSASAIDTGTIADARLPLSAKVWQELSGSISYTGSKVSIGSAPNPGAKLYVQGTIVSKNVVNSTFSCSTPNNIIDFSIANFVSIEPSTTISGSSCAVSLEGLIDGGTYTLVMSGNAAVNSITFVFSADGAPTFKYLPSNGSTIAGKDTIYTFLKNNSKIYVTWSSGY